MAGRLVRPVQVTARQVFTGDIQFGRRPGRHRVEALVEQVDPVMRGGNTDRDRCVPVRLRIEAMLHAADHGLGRPVLVVDLDVAQFGLGARGQLRFQVFAAEDQPADARQGPGLLQHQRQVRGRQLDDVGFVGLEHPQHGQVVAGAVFGIDRHRATAGQRDEDRGDGQVEAHRRVEGETDRGAPGVGLQGPVRVGRQGRMLHDDAFWAAGGARGIDHAGRLRGLDLRQLDASVRPVLRRSDEHGVDTRSGRPVLQVAVADDAADSGVFDDKGQALGGQARLERHERPAGFQDSKDGNEEVEASAQVDSDVFSRLASPADQLGRQSVGERVQFRIRDGPVFFPCRDRVRRAAGTRRKRVQHQRCTGPCLAAVEAVQLVAAFVFTEQCHRVDGRFRVLEKGVDDTQEMPAHAVADPGFQGRGVDVQVGDDLAAVRQVVQVDAQVVTGVHLPGMKQFGRHRLAIEFAEGGADVIQHHVERAGQRRRTASWLRPAQEGHGFPADLFE